MSDQSGHSAASDDGSVAAPAGSADDAEAVPRDGPVTPSDDRRAIPSRTDRLTAFLNHNRDRLVVDAAILLAWILATGLVFQWLGLPRWLHYMVLFLGIVVYSRSTPTWERPYRPPE